MFILLVIYAWYCINKFIPKNYIKVLFKLIPPLKRLTIDIGQKSFFLKNRGNFLKGEKTKL